MNTMTTSSSSKLPLSPPHHLPHFTPIQECEDEEFEECSDFKAPSSRYTNKAEAESKHHPTPLHQPSSRRRRQEFSHGGDDGVSCYKCRPSHREKISVVPLDNNGVTRRHSSSSPNGLFKSILCSLTKKSPRIPPPEEEQWKSAAAELSQKLIQATRKRDEALLEASRLKSSMAELEEKLNNLKIYCHNLNSGLEMCTNNHTNRENLIQHFMDSVSEAQSRVRLLSRSLTIHLRQMRTTKVLDRISLLLQPYDINLSLSKNPRALILYLEALLNKAFYEDFESIGFQKSAPSQILNPMERCEANFASFNRLQGLTWDGVLSKGTRHFSEEFSMFCDRKMSEIVAMLGWDHVWPEQLLRDFFGAAKGVWLVHHLANSVHPSLTIFRVDKGVIFDEVYMEDMNGSGGGNDKAPKLVPIMVQIMVTPGFYLYGNVLKSKMLCKYNNNNNNDGGEKGLNSFPV
ncbi:hypothetical protein CsSME_00050257 [Camellia sinensis var. sinensis]